MDITPELVAKLGFVSVIAVLLILSVVTYHKGRADMCRELGLIVTANSTGKMVCKEEVKPNYIYNDALAYDYNLILT